MAQSESCIFCEIVAGFADAEVVSEDELVLAFLDINPVADGHTLVVPKVHAPGLTDIPRQTASRMMQVAQRIAVVLRISGFDMDGINLHMADGAAAGQDVFHSHLHVIPRLKGDPVVIDLPANRRSSRVLKETAAQLRNALRQDCPTDRSVDVDVRAEGDTEDQLVRLSVRELLVLGDRAIGELRARGLVRTNNKPIGDIAEQIVSRARGGVLEPNSTKSHDVTTASGVKIQVKAMGARAAGAQTKFSPFRSFGFETAVFLVFDSPGFGLIEAWEVPAERIQSEVRFVPYVNGRQPGLRQVRAMGVDVLDEMRTAYEALDEISVEDA